ncbi:hypothetical protein B0H10DRAFT_1959952 [Mycena sp. CBHHK59/15]|nr:hypothetical protein B0H10DRAFT_1959952 [Mycena sp. CBHHK59/15]
MVPASPTYVKRIGTFLIRGHTRTPRQISAHPPFNGSLAIKTPGHSIANIISACTEKGDHFEACIATNSMNSTSWKYVHDSQIILNGTFGVCDSRLLLFIVMAVDENRKGIPITSLLFSAPSGNKQLSSGYNTSIVAKLVDMPQTATNCPLSARQKLAALGIKMSLWQMDF